MKFTKYLFLAVCTFSLIAIAWGCGGSSSGQPANEYISSISPADGATGVDFFTPVTVVFSRDIDETTLTADNVKLTTADGVFDVPGTISYDAATRTLTFTPTFPYWAEALYSLVISNAVVTKANGDSAASQASFTTAVRPVLFRSNLNTAYNADTNPNPSPPTGQWNVWTMNADGTEKMAFTNNEVPLESSWGFFANSWSPGYQYVAYQTVYTGVVTIRDLWIANSDGSNPKSISGGLSEGDLSRVEEVIWAPDGSKIYFTYSTQAGQPHNLYVFDLSHIDDPSPTDYATRLTNDPDYEVGEMLRISPDGTRLLYRWREMATDRKELYVIELDSPTYNTQELTPSLSSTESVFQIEYSPDGTMVYFAVGETGSAANQNIYSGALDTNGTAFTSTSNLTDFDEDPREYSTSSFGVSPDGSQIAYIYGPLVPTPTDPRYMTLMSSADGTNIGNVTSTELSLGRPLWSPDGTMLAFGMGSLLVGEAFNLYVVDSSGTATALNLTNFSTQFQYDNKCLWSTDSTQLLFTVNDSINGISQIWIAAADGTSSTNITQVGGLGVSFVLFDWWQPVFNNIAN